MLVDWRRGEVPENPTLALHPPARQAVGHGLIQCRFGKQVPLPFNRAHEKGFGLAAIFPYR
jgi:hypothetical protein